MTTEQSSVAGGGYIADRCKRIQADGTTSQLTVVNWSGIVAAIALCLGAWLAGASLSGRMDSRNGAIAVGACAAVLIVAVVTFFV